MANYLEITKNVALRTGEAGSIVGTDSAAIEAVYNSTELNATHIDNPAFPFTPQRDAILFAEEKIAEIVASQKKHPLRKFLRGVTVPLANRVALPTVDSNNVQVIGVIGNVRDVSDNNFLTELEDLRELERLIRLSNGSLKAPVYRYGIDGQTIIHTRTQVIVEVCKYSRGAQRVAIIAGGAMLFPETLEETIMCGAISYLSRKDEPSDEQYLKFWNDSLARLEKGMMPQS